MQSVRYYIFALMICVISGCVSLVSVNSRIEEAQRYLETLKGVSGGIGMKRAAYPPEFRQAEEKLGDARTRLKEGDRKQADSDAEQAIELSQKALKKIIHGPLKEEAAGLKKEIEKKGEDTSLKALLLRLDKIMDYANAVETGLKVMFEDGVSICQQYIQVKETVRKNIVRRVEASEVSFGVGKYKISDLKGKRSLDKIVGDVITAKTEFLRQFQGSAMISIKTTGYTDTQPFNEDVGALVEKCGRAFSQKESGRQALNQCLSRLRAETIGQYISDEILKRDSALRIKKEAVGRGEEMPPGLTTPSSSNNDPGRRICIVDISITSAD